MTALVLATGTVAAQAGEYHVYSCRTPSGEGAPADGWSGSVAGTAAYAEDTCQKPGGALVAALGQAKRTANTDDRHVGVRSACRRRRIAGATLWRAGDAAGGAVVNATYQFWLAGPNRNGHL